MPDELLSAEDIFSIKDIKDETIDVPEWPGKDGKPGRVRVRGMTALERDAYDQSVVATVVGPDGYSTKTQVNYVNAKARCVVNCVINKQGGRVFEDKMAGPLGEKSAGAINRIFRKIQDLSGLTEQAREELAKNSAGGQAAASPSSSPATSK